MVIGICGGSGSGKTTLLKRLSNHFKDKAPTIFSMDNYYKPIEMQFVDENKEVNFDLPTALYQDRLEADIQALSRGESIEVIEYHFNAPPDKRVLISLQPSELIIVEGLFLFHFEGVKSVLDFSIFIDVDLDVQLDRRLYRDQESRGYTSEAIMYQWNNHVLPCYNKYLLPYKDEANFIFRNNQYADEDFVNLVQVIENEFQKQAIY